MKEIERHILKKIKQAGKTFPVLAIVGPRQVGKTTLVKQYASSVKKKSVYLDLEMPSDFKRINDDAELFLSGLDDCIVIIDEVQRKPDLFPIIRALVDQNRRPLRFILLGSASPDLIQNASETLAGRIAYIELTPFNYTEIADVGSIQKHHIRGGFPKPFLMRNNSDVQLWYENFVSTYVERDLPVLGLKASPQIVRKLWQMLANLNGHPVNYSMLGSSLGVSHTTVRNYVELLSSTFMLQLLPSFTASMGKRLVKSPKVYLNDIGITNALLRVPDFEQLAGHPSFGAAWEAVVLINLTASFPQFNFFFYRTSHGAEIDIIVENGGKRIAVECKAGILPKLSIGTYTALEDIQPQVTLVVAPVDKGWSMKKGIEVVNISEAITTIRDVLG